MAVAALRLPGRAGWRVSGCCRPFAYATLVGLLSRHVGAALLVPRGAPRRLTCLSPLPAWRQVAAFWSKAQRVVAFKVRSEVEAKKKEVMDKQVCVWVCGRGGGARGGGAYRASCRAGGAGGDRWQDSVGHTAAAGRGTGGTVPRQEQALVRGIQPRMLVLTRAAPPVQPHPANPPQLDFLLGQTQKYSTMLAERLKGEEAAKAAAALAAVGSQPLSAAPSLAAPSPSGGEGGEEVATLRPRRSHPAVSPVPLPSAAVSGTAGGLRSPGLGRLRLG